MRLTPSLCRQHIDFMFKKHWLVQGKRIPYPDGTEEVLRKHGIKVVDANDFVTEKVEYEQVEVIDKYKKEPAKDETHPDYKPTPCYTIDRYRVLLEGIRQAQVITKTVIAENILPESLEEMSTVEVPEPIHVGVKKAILSACVFDAEQKKLPKRKDPNRPMYNFRRDLGITDVRKNIILTNKMLQIVERSSDIESSTSKYTVNNALCNAIFEKDSELIQFKELCNIFVSSQKPLQYEVNTPDDAKQIPNIYPVKHTVTLEEDHFYDSTLYPIQSTVSKRHPHTTWLHVNRTQISNEFEEPVSREQELGRGLVHSFAIAAAYAHQLYGAQVKELPEPIYLNCIQTDGRHFHLGVLQLNTLQLDGCDGTKNVWFTRTDMPLYGRCQYVSAIPTLEEYNPRVVGYINAMYNS